MQIEYVTLAHNAPTCGDLDDYYEVVNITHEFPEQGYSYDDMKAGLCRSYVRVTLEKLYS